MAEDSNNPQNRELSETEKMVQEALAEAQSAVNSIQSQTGGADDDASSDAADGQAAAIDLPDLGGFGSGSGGSDEATPLDLLGDVDLNVTVELGRTEMLVEDVLKLGEGSVVELDKLAGDPVDVYVNGRLVARGEVLVLNENFCIRISEIVDDLEEQAAAAAAENSQVA